MKLQLRFLLLLVGVHAVVGAMFLQFEALRFFKEAESGQRRDQDVRDTVDAWLSLIRPPTGDPVGFVEFAPTPLSAPPYPPIAFSWKEEDGWMVWYLTDVFGSGFVDPDVSPPQPATPRVRYAGWPLERLAAAETKTWRWIPPGEPASTDVRTIPLPALPDLPPGLIAITPASADINPVKALGIANLKFLGILLALSTLVVSLLIYLWFVRPMSTLIAAMNDESSARLGSLSAKSGEVGQMARLIARSFDQKNQLRREISLRDAAENTLRAREQQLERLLCERENLHRNLHDEIIQRVFALGLRIESLKGAKPQSADEMRQTFSDLRGFINELIQKLRDYLEEPSTPLGRSYPLGRMITALADDMQRAAGVPVRVVMKRNDHEVPGDSMDLDGKFDDMRGRGLVALATEALSNAVRHSAATEIEVTLAESDEDGFTLTISDNGRGCDLSSVVRGRGLENMRHRADQLGGKLEMRSAPGAGFTVEWHLPQHKSS